jgi:fructose-specific phosphotransferase system IIC component
MMLRNGTVLLYLSIDSMLPSIVFVGSGAVLVALSMMIAQMTLNRKKEEEIRYNDLINDVYSNGKSTDL